MMNDPGLVIDANQSTFARDVLERSAELPVVVDFWAPWCAPCRVLGPILEREVAALGGRVALVKLNIDESPELSTRFGVQSIPAVKAFRDGKIVDEFVGALPAAQVRAWLARLAPSASVHGLASAEELFRAGRPADAAPILRGLLADAEVADRARLALARVLMDLGQPDEVPGLLAAIDPRSEAAEGIATLERRLRFLTDAAAFGGEEAARRALQSDPRSLEAAWALASAEAARGDHRAALEGFLAIVSRNRTFKDDGARLAMLALFDHLGAEHELTQELRRRLQIVL
jgi:putative thioredoxin